MLLGLSVMPTLFGNHISELNKWHIFRGQVSHLGKWPQLTHHLVLCPVALVISFFPERLPVRVIHEFTCALPLVPEDYLQHVFAPFLPDAYLPPGVAPLQHPWLLALFVLCCRNSLGGACSIHFGIDSPILLTHMTDCATTGS